MNTTGSSTYKNMQADQSGTADPALKFASICISLTPNSYSSRQAKEEVINWQGQPPTLVREHAGRPRSIHSQEGGKYEGKIWW